MPDDEKESPNPRVWSLQKIIEWSKNTAYPLTEDSSPEEIVKARNKAVSEAMNESKAKKAEAMLRIKERVKMHYEMGTDIKAIVTSYHVKSRDIEKWAVTEKWNRPEEKGAPMSDADALEVDADFGIVSRESEEKMPTHVRQMREQKRLMGLRGKQWENVPYEIQQDALRKRSLMLVVKLTEYIETLSPDELLSEHKAVEKLIGMVKDVAPIPEDSGGKKMLLHMSIFNGEEGLPPKAAKVIDVAPAEPKNPMDDPML